MSLSLLDSVDAIDDLLSSLLAQEITTPPWTRPDTPLNVIMCRNPRGFALFPYLPLELRRKVWAFAVSIPRVLQIVHTPVRVGNEGLRPPMSLYKVLPASYGGYHPAILSVNRESRSEALFHLTPLWGAYWNLKTDLPYMQWKQSNEHDWLGTISALQKSGDLDRFKHIVLDWTHLVSYKSIAILPRLNEVTFIVPGGVPSEYVIPRGPWRLGPHSGFRFEAEKFARNRLRGELKDLLPGRDLQINFKSIHTAKKRDAWLPSPLDYSRLTYRDQVEALESEKFVLKMTRRL